MATCETCGRPRATEEDSKQIGELWNAKEYTEHDALLDTKCFVAVGGVCIDSVKKKLRDGALATKKKLRDGALATEEAERVRCRDGWAAERKRADRMEAALLAVVTSVRIPVDDYGPERVGYMFGADDGTSAIFPTPAEALERAAKDLKELRALEDALPTCRACKRVATKVWGDDLLFCDEHAARTSDSAVDLPYAAALRARRS